MKKVLKNILIVILLGVFTLAPVFVGAQAALPPPGSGVVGPPAPEETSDGGIFGSAFSKIGDVVTSIIEIPNNIMIGIGNAALRLVGFFTWLASVFLNEIIQFSIVEMSQQVNTISAINIGWEAFRDIANLTFIFIILFIAIGLIIGNETYNTRSVMVRLIIVALLINFSLFFTKVVIDSSNILAIEFYKKTGIEEARAADSGFAGMLMGVTNVGSIYSLEAGGVTNLSGVTGDRIAGVLTKPTEFFVMLIMSAVFLLVLTFVFIAMGVLLLSRFVMLIFLMVASPLAFAAYILPSTASWTRQWWNNLIKNAFFAPAFFILMWFVMNMVTSTEFRNLSGYTDDQTIPQLILGNSFGIAMNFFLVTAFLIGAMSLATSMSINGAGGVIRIGNKLGKFGRGFVAQRTVGKAAGAIGTRYNEASARVAKRLDTKATTGLGRATQFVAKNIPLAGAIDRGISGGLKTAAEAGYGAKKPSVVAREKKARSAELAGIQRKDEFKQALEAWSANPTDATVKTSIRDKVEGLSKKEVTAMDTKKLIKIAQFLDKDQMEAIEKAKDPDNKDVDKFTDAEQRQIKEARQQPLTDALDNYSDAKKVLKDSPSAEAAANVAQATDALKNFINGMSKKEKQSLSSEQLEKISGPDILGQGEFDALAKEVNTETKNAMRAARIKVLREAISATTPDPGMIASAVKDFKPKDFMKAVPDELKKNKEVVKNYTVDHLAAMVDIEGGMLPSVLAEIRTNIDANRAEGLAGDQKRAYEQIETWMKTSAGKSLFNIEEEKSSVVAGAKYGGPTDTSSS